MTEDFVEVRDFLLSRLAKVDGEYMRRMELRRHDDWPNREVTLPSIRAEWDAARRPLMDQLVRLADLVTPTIIITKAQLEALNVADLRDVVALVARL